MDRASYARTQEALRVAEVSLARPRPNASVDDWNQFDGHSRIVAAMHRTLGDFGGALRIMSHFLKAIDTEAPHRPELNRLAIKASTTVWAWTEEANMRHDRLMQFRAGLLDAEIRNDVHAERALRMGMADHEEQSGNFGEAAAQLYAVMRRLPPLDRSIADLRERVDDLEARADLQRGLMLPADQRTPLPDHAFLAEREIDLTPSLVREPAHRTAPSMN